MKLLLLIIVYVLGLLNFAIGSWWCLSPEITKRLGGGLAILIAIFISLYVRKIDQMKGGKGYSSYITILLILLLTQIFFASKQLEGIFMI